MINLKLGLGALALEIGAWSGPLMLEDRSDVALATYLAAHALASVLLALTLLPLLASARARPRRAVLAMMASFSFAVPIAGFIGIVLAVVVLHIYRRPVKADDFQSLQLPEFDLHQRMQGSFRQAGLRSFLGNSHAPAQARMSAMVALQFVSGRVASPLLRTVLSDPSEDLRLLAYGMLDTLEKRINRAIDAELQVLRTTEATDDPAGPPSPEALAALHRLSDLYWELIYQQLVQGDLRDHAVKESLRYCDKVLQHVPGHPQLTLRRGRLLYEQGHAEAAAEAYAKARSLGMPATRLLPYQAELAFQRRDFADVEALVRELNQWDALPRLRPVIDYWSGSR